MVILRGILPTGTWSLCNETNNYIIYLNNIVNLHTFMKLHVHVCFVQFPYLSKKVAFFGMAYTCQISCVYIYVCFGIYWKSCSTVPYNFFL